jgi:hypothetical protein
MIVASSSGRIGTLSVPRRIGKAHQRGRSLPLVFAGITPMGGAA